MKTKITIQILLICLAFFGFAEISQAATYYVSPTGSAAWTNCSGTTPLNGASACSWQTAMANAVAGDIVYFRGGTYEPGEGGLYSVPPAMNPAHSGTPGNYITFQAYPGETATIHEATPPVGASVCATCSPTRPAIGAYLQNYIIWDGFTLDRNLHQGIGASGMVQITEANHIIIRNNNMTGRPHKDHQNGCLIYIEGKGDSSYIYIYNNKLHGMTADPNPIEPVVNASAIWVFDANHVYMYNNDIYDNNNGISWKSRYPNYLYVYNNYFYDCSRNTINVLSQDTVSNMDYYIYQNVIRNCNAAIGGDPAVPILDNLKIYNNTVYTPTNQSFVNLGTNTNHPFINMEVYNNIYYTNSAPAFNSASRGSYYYNLAPNTASFPVYLDNNIYYGPGQWMVNRYDASQATYTSLSAWQTAINADLHSSESNPLFVNAGGASPADYKLQSNSPARTGGRGGIYAPAMGAYITGNEVIGYVAPTVVDTTPPAAPTGLGVQ